MLVYKNTNEKLILKLEFYLKSKIKTHIFILQYCYLKQYIQTQKLFLLEIQHIQI